MKNKVKIIEANLAENTTATGAIQTRLNQAIAQQNTAQQSYDSARAERQTTLASGGEVTASNAKIKLAQDALDLADDAVTGCNSELSRLSGEREKLLAEHAAAVLNQDTEELKSLAATYNSQAEQLAKTVKDIFVVRRRLREDPSHSKVINAVPGWRRNALEIIPRLYLQGEKVPTLLTEQSFFDAAFLQ